MATLIPQHKTMMALKIISVDVSTAKPGIMNVYCEIITHEIKRVMINCTGCFLKNKFHI